jgi:hypothetical protein
VVITAVQTSREQHEGENVLAIRIRYDVISANAPETRVILGGIEQRVLLNT